MATTTLNTRIQLKNDTEANWLLVADTAIPLVGEICITNDGEHKGQFKIGDGVTTWGDLPYANSGAGPQGPEGPPGPQGPAGQAATIQIGSVTSGDAPAVTNSGTKTDAVLDFVLQQGPAGPQGPQGDSGPEGPQGPAGAGVPSTEGVPTDYLLSPAGWVAPPSGGGAKPIRFLNRIETTEAVKSIEISEDSEGKTFEELGLTEVYGAIKTAQNVDTNYNYGTLEINDIGIIMGQNFNISVGYRFYLFSFTLLEDGSGISLFRFANSGIAAGSSIAYGIAVNDAETMGVVNFGNVIKKLSIRHANIIAEAVLKAGTIILVYGR